jgi:hypothetical protein
MKKASFAVFTLFMTLAALFQAPDVHADSAAIANGSSSINSACGVTESDLMAIKTIQGNTSLSYTDELQQELAARRNLLSKTIQCAKTGAEQDKTAIDNSKVSSNLESLKNQWSDKLNSAISYYDLQLQKINDTGISGTEAIAREVFTWRQNNYAPLAENVSNFIMWSDNQGLFTTAQNRLAQINNLTDSALFSQNADVQNDYEEAAVSLKTAEDQNAAAQNAFAQSLAPDQTLSLIKKSLDSLSSTYQHFFDVSNLIQSLLPH